MSEDRLWKFRKPEWMKSVHARNAGVYSAGALVSYQFPRRCHGHLWPCQPPGLWPTFASLTPKTLFCSSHSPFYVLLDAAVWSKSVNGSDVHINFVDWLPLIFSALGMLIINSVEKARLGADSFSYNGTGVAWKARVVLFLGFAALAGGMAGGVTVFVLKFVVPGVQWPMMSMEMRTWWLMRWWD